MQLKESIDLFSYHCICTRHWNVYRT